MDTSPVRDRGSLQCGTASATGYLNWNITAQAVVLITVVGAARVGIPLDAHWASMEGANSVATILVAGNRLFLCPDANLAVREILCLTQANVSVVWWTRKEVVEPAQCLAELNNIERRRKPIMLSKKGGGQ